MLTDFQTYKNVTCHLRLAHFHNTFEDGEFLLTTHQGDIPSLHPSEKQNNFHY